MKNIHHLCIQSNQSILSALKQMDKTNRKLLIVMEGSAFLSLLSIGDIQRAIIGNSDVELAVSKILRENVKVANVADDLDVVKAHMRKKRNEFMPIISNKKELIDVIFWEDIFPNEEKTIHSNINIPVVIMAGGEGSRLKPLTNVLPKPLIPITEKSIIEEIIQKFINVGCVEFYVSLNYKAKMIQQYLDAINFENVNITYIKENEPLGTSGSLSLLKDKIHSTFFVSNCDILIDQDINDIYNYHKLNKNTLTIVSALKHYQIPYGTVVTGQNGKLMELSEKPEMTFQINTGMYILEPELLNEIPKNTFFHITDLIEKVKNSGRVIGVFPVSEGSWKDIGEWKEYLKTILHV